jgi:hypothetical protein
MVDWFYRQTGIGAQAIEADRDLKRAFESAQNRNILAVSDRQLLQGPNGRFLYAVNKRGRQLWSRALASEFSQFFGVGLGHLYPDQPLFLVTLADRSCVTAHDAKEIDIAGFIRQLRQGLMGLSYLAMIEPAYYVNIVNTPYFSGKRAVSWHVHAVCWGESRNQIKSRIDRLNNMAGNFRPIAEGIPAAHVKGIPRTFARAYHLAIKFGYILKSPKYSYRIYRRSRPSPKDPSLVNFSFKQRKGVLRPGERIALFRLMKDLFLDHLTFAGGQGTNILRRAKRRALKYAK